MLNDTNISIDEKTTKLRKAKKFVEEDDVNGTESHLQAITLAQTPQTEKAPSKTHPLEASPLPEISHVETRPPSPPLTVETRPPSRSLEVKTTAVPLPLKEKEAKRLAKQKTKGQSSASKRAIEEAQMLRLRCKQMCVSTFFQEHTTVRSLGFTSAIHGEGKSFLARLSAEAMAEDDSTPVTLIECNWEHPTLSTAFNLRPGPGLAEWLLEDCSIAAIRQQVKPNLTVIPAGDGKNNTVGLLRAFQQRGTLDLLTRPGEVLIIDLPSITTTTYGQLAARLVDAIILVVRMGVTPESLITEASNMLKDLPVQGVIFNQVMSQTPRWLRQIL